MASEVVGLAGVALACCATGGALGDVYVSQSAPGWATPSTLFGAKARNADDRNGDWEINLGSSPGSVTQTSHAVWQSPGVANVFSIGYVSATGTAEFSWNDATVSWMAGEQDVNSVFIQLRASNRGDPITVSVDDLRLNGEELIGASTEPSLRAASFDGETGASWLQIGGDAFGGGEWTLTGTLTAHWEGRGPSRDHTRVEFIAASDAAARPLVPGPSAFALFALGGVAMMRRSRG